MFTISYFGYIRNITEETQWRCDHVIFTANQAISVSVASLLSRILLA